ncbi:MAG TPA: ATP synthase F1 subunit delta, partial [Spirochaetota bacterium]|nr:ATP synthase F1 subunit delta [Spirochaetota bacterium]
LVDNGRQALLKSINEAFVELLDVVNNRQRVTVISSMKLGKDVLDKVQASLSEKLKKNIILDDAVDESILGGIILRMGDIILDGSMANDLKNIRHNLLNSKVRGDRAYED